MMYVDRNRLTLFVSALVSPRFVRVWYQSAVAVQERHGEHSAFQSENRTCEEEKKQQKFE